MLSQTLKRCAGYLLLVAIFTMLASSAKPQERKTLPANGELPINKGDCPNPISLTLTAKNPTSFDAADVSSVQLATPHMTGLGDPSYDKNFLYTFHWKREKRCCQITRAVLTVVMKSNQPGQSKTSSDAGNDGIAIMHLGNTVPPYNEPVYSNWPFGVGQSATKTWNLTGAALNNINQFDKLTIVNQDDTKVDSATLQLWGCCLSDNSPQPVGYTTQEECERVEKAPSSVQIAGWHRTN